MKLLLTILFVFGVTATYVDLNAADSNTVSSTVVTNNTPPTANSPSVVVNNSVMYVRVDILEVFKLKS